MKEVKATFVANLRRLVEAQPVLVTGGTGFIGSYVVSALLDKGAFPVAFDIREFSPEARHVIGRRVSSIVVEQGSVEDSARVLKLVQKWKPKHIVHLATIANPAFLARNPIPGIRVNFLGTINMLEAARCADVTRFIYFSSTSVLPERQYEPIDASHPIFLPKAAVPSGVYGASKIASEAFCFAYHNAFGIDFRTIRASAVYGFGMQLPIYVKPMVEGAVRGEPVLLASGARYPRDYTHVADIASLAVALLEAPDEADRIFYGATGEALVTAAEVAEIVKELVPDAEILIADEFTPEDRLGLAYRGRLSIESARAIGWSPHFASIRDGLADYIERYRSFLARSTAN